MEADEPVRDVLAANLRRVRTARNLSLSGLSRLSKIGKATLSQLEAGAGNPTIETVFSLSRALEVPISSLLDQPRGDGLTMVRAADVEVLRGDGVDLRALGIATGDTVVEVCDQQVRSRQEFLGHTGTEHTVVQAGHLRVRVDDREVELGSGDYVGFDARLPHTYVAVEGPCARCSSCTTRLETGRATPPGRRSPAERTVQSRSSMMGTNSYGPAGGVPAGPLMRAVRLGDVDRQCIGTAAGPSESVASGRWRGRNKAGRKATASRPTDHQ